MNSITPNLNIMIKACEKVSKVIIRDFGEIENLQVSKKGPRDFVTKTDRRAEEIIIEELSKSKKNFSFLSEEAGKINNKVSELLKTHPNSSKRVQEVIENFKGKTQLNPIVGKEIFLKKIDGIILRQKVKLF